jgi:hypothetical protein
MSFDKKRFMKTSFEPRTEAVPVPDLKDFFGEGAEALWKVRGLTGHELGKVNEAEERNRNLVAIMEALVSVKAAEKADAVKKLIGLDDSTPSDIARRLEMLVIGSEDPACDQEMSVRICTHFPIEFIQLTNTITKLTGMGAQVKKKPSSSGMTPA